VTDVGDTYADFGATATDSQGHSLDVKTYLNGSIVSNIMLDTSEAATDTIDYVPPITGAIPRPALAPCLLKLQATSTVQ
jgi:hypothetical protein